MSVIAKSQEELQSIVKAAIEFTPEGLRIIDEAKLRSSIIDSLIYTAVFSSDTETSESAKSLIRAIANEYGTITSSIHELYMAMGRGEVSGFTTPAINLRCMTYDVARRVFKLAKEKNIGAFIFEIARSEIRYTLQHPSEYASCILAAAVKEGFRGPVFIQGDHFQFNSKQYKNDPEGELRQLKAITKEAILAGFYNIDIDASTLVDYSSDSLDQQQHLNYLNTALITGFIRDIEPDGITVSVGAEIGHIGGKNSTVQEAEAFMEGYARTLKEQFTPEMKGISKISVQTGTSHGGVPLPDGSVAEVNLDFNVLRDIGAFVKERYGLSGTVQHGASTLPEELFDRFPLNNCSEIHLATGFQNIMYEHAPEAFRKEIYEYLKTNHKDEWKEDMTEEQFLYKTRKKGFGPFKRQWWMLSEDEKHPILNALEEKFSFLFERLGVFETAQYTQQYIKPVKIAYKAGSTGSVDLTQEGPEEEGAD